MLPGGGHRVLGSRSTSAVVGISSALLFATGVATLMSGEQAYETYNRSTDYATANALYADANSKRRAGRLQVQLGAALWVGDAVLNWFLAAGHNSKASHDRL